jgi:hypothetical protein
LLFWFDVTIGSQVEGVALELRMTSTSKYWYRFGMGKQKYDFSIVCNTPSIPCSAQNVTCCSNFYSLGFQHPVYFTKHAFFFDKMKLIHNTQEI